MNSKPTNGWSSSRSSLAQQPERELFCPVCGVKTTIITFDAIECDPSPKALYYIIGPYSAMCDRCGSVLRTIHPTPEAALDYWRDYAQTAGQHFFG
jgi:rRNA maturation protein Nop10